MLLDPGAHVIILSRKGFEDAVVNRTFSAGMRESLSLEIDTLPATLVVNATQPEAVVTVDGRDVGFAPVTLSRPGGRYAITVEKDGFTSYESVATIDPGEVWRVSAELSEEPPALYERWWFWTAIGGGVAAVAITTYLVARPEPTRAEPNGGGLGWVVEVPSSQPALFTF
jgi:hypothetical protein